MLSNDPFHHTRFDMPSGVGMPMGVNWPVARSTVPNCWLRVTTYTFGAALAEAASKLHIKETTSANRANLATGRPQPARCTHHKMLDFITPPYSLRDCA